MKIEEQKTHIDCTDLCLTTYSCFAPRKFSPLWLKVSDFSTLQVGKRCEQATHHVSGQLSHGGPGYGSGCWQQLGVSDLKIAC